MIQENVSLKNHSTMRLGGTARYFCEVNSQDTLVETLNFAREKQLNVRVIGEGSNIIWSDKGFDGLVIVNKLTGFCIHDDGETVSIGAGEVWDEAVKKSVEAGLSGIEFLSLIPGTAGATPVQNVGAYGCEIAQVLTSVKVYDRQTGEVLLFANEQCEFGYRMSRFKKDPTQRYIIIEITLKLSKESPKPPFYDALSKYFSDHGITEYSPTIVRDAVIAIRTSKLPDPYSIANNGSFFANPIIEIGMANALKASHPEMPVWPINDTHAKIPAGWLIEHVGMKGFHDAETGMATWDSQALVLINEHAEKTADLLKFKEKIVRAVQEKYNIVLEQEPELL